MKNEELLDKNAGKIAKMFDTIASSYDQLNHILSLGIDKGWRKKLLRQVQSAGAKNVLDLACGSGDVSIALYKAGLNVTGADISEKMLEIARQKSAKLSPTNNSPINYLWANAAHLPFEDHSFDAVTISFGIRNFDHLDDCVQELARVLKPTGSLHVLEFGIPSNPIWRSLYCFYAQHILPTIGGWISGDKSAYTYLPASTLQFPFGQKFIDRIQSASNGAFKKNTAQKLSGGIAYLYLLNK